MITLNLIYWKNVKLFNSLKFELKLVPVRIELEFFFFEVYWIYNENQKFIIGYYLLKKRNPDKIVP